MKKILILASVLALSFSAGVSAEESVALGDVNGDGSITLTDAQMALKYALNINSAKELPAMDYNARMEA